MILVLCVLVAVYAVSRVPIVRANLPVGPGGSSPARRAILRTQGLLCVFLLGPIFAGFVHPLVIIAVVPGAISALMPVSGPSPRVLVVRESLHLVWFFLSVAVSYGLGGFAALQDLLGA